MIKVTLSRSTDNQKESMIGFASCFFPKDKAIDVVSKLLCGETVSLKFDCKLRAWQFCQGMCHFQYFDVKGPL